jgi:hypothetical protein
MSDQNTAFSPPVVCELMDGSRIRFARAKSKIWAEMSAEIHASQLPATYADIAADASLKPEQRITLRKRARESLVTINTAMNMCLTVDVWIEKFLLRCAKECGHSEEDAKRALDLIPTIEQQEIAEQLAMLPVVSNVKTGTDENPLKPGAVLIGSESRQESGDSTDSTPANSPTEPSSSTTT